MNGIENKFMVSTNEDGIFIMNLPSDLLSVKDAVNLAAWLIIMSDAYTQFERTYYKIEQELN